MKKIFYTLGLLVLFCLPTVAKSTIYCDVLIDFSGGTSGNVVTQSALGNSIHADGTMGTWNNDVYNTFTSGGTDPFQASYFATVTKTFPVPIVIGGASYTISSGTIGFEEYENPAAQCTGAGSPVISCTGSGTGVTYAQVASCTGSGAPYASCTASGKGRCACTEDAKVPIPSGAGANGLTMGVLLQFDLSAANAFTNYPMFNIWSSEGNQSFCSFNVSTANGVAAPYVRTENSLNGSNDYYGTPNINLQNNTQYWASLLYQPGPASASSTPPNNSCTGSGAPWACCATAGTGTCGLCQLDVFETSTWTLIGTSSGAISNYAAYEVKFGKPGAGYTASSGGTVQIKAIILDWTNRRFPLGPVGIETVANLGTAGTLKNLGTAGTLSNMQ